MSQRPNLWIVELAQARSLLAAVSVAAIGLGACRSPPPQPTDGSARVVALTPSATEIVAAVAGPEVLVAVDEYSDFPPQVAALPRVGNFVTPSLEAILGQRPDLVVLDRVQARVEGALRAAGVKTLMLRMETVADLRAGIGAVGAALGHPQAAADLIDEIDRELAAVAAEAERVRAGGPRPRVLFVVDREPGALRSMVATGPGSYLDELVRLSGGENVLGNASAQFLRISAEQVLQSSPDVILDGVHVASSAPGESGPASEAGAAWLPLTSVPAVAAGRVHILGDTAHMHPGPRIGRSLRLIARLLYPSANL